MGYGGNSLYRVWGCIASLARTFAFVRRAVATFVLPLSFRQARIWVGVLSFFVIAELVIRPPSLFSFDKVFGEVLLGLKPFLL